MYCKNCGKGIPDDSNFCSKCGVEIKSVHERKQDIGVDSQVKRQETPPPFNEGIPMNSAAELDKKVAEAKTWLTFLIALCITELITMMMTFMSFYYSSTDRFGTVTGFDICFSGMWMIFDQTRIAIWMVLISNIALLIMSATLLITIRKPNNVLRKAFICDGITNGVFGVLSLVLLLMAGNYIERYGWSQLYNGAIFFLIVVLATSTISWFTYRSLLKCNLPC